MKKLMIVAAAAAMTVAAKADLQWVSCPDCGKSSEAAECDYQVFKVTASGKAVVVKKDYKTVGKLKIKKGALALSGSIQCETGDCCYDAGTLFATVKAGSAKFKAAIPVEVPVWSTFGKKLSTVADSAWKTLKKSKKVKLESALYIRGSEIVVTDADDLDASFDEFTLEAAAFGKVNFKVYDSKSSKTVCGKDDSECGYEIVPKKYKGWFVGTYTCVGEESCFACDCGLDIYGGTWKASFSEKYSTDKLTGAYKLAGVSSSDFDEE